LPSQRQVDTAADAHPVQVQTAENEADDGVDDRTFDQQLDNILGQVERSRFDAGIEARLAELHPQVRAKAIEQLRCFRSSTRIRGLGAGTAGFAPINAEMSYSRRVVRRRARW
jgi:hypothetical protein